MHNEKITEGVTCVVNSCHYHTQEDLCTAGQIEIKPKNARSVDDTDCGTYEKDNALK